MVKKETDIKLYNLIFPIWLLWLFPMTWIVVLPMNFLIDSAVVLITLKALKISDYKMIYKDIIFKVWGFGFLADFIGTALMFIPIIIDGILDYSSPFGHWWHEHLTSALSFNPFENIFAVIWVTVTVFITSLFIYLLNYKVSFKKLDIEEKAKRKLALSLGIFTAPYLFYLPTMWFY